MKKYTHDEAWTALWKVLLRCDIPLREQLLAEAAARDCHEMDEAEAFVDAFCKAVAKDDAQHRFAMSVDWLSEVKAVLQVD